MGTYPVDERADVLVDSHVGSGGELVVGSEPWREGRVREDVLALGKRLPEGLREGGDPLLCRAVALVHRRQVLVVDINAVEAVRLDPCSHRVACADGVRVRGGGGVGRAERGGDDLDAGLGVFVLLGGLGGSGEGGPVAGLVDGALECEEGQRNDIVALRKNVHQTLQAS